LRGNWRGREKMEGSEIGMEGIWRGFEERKIYGVLRLFFVRITGYLWKKEHMHRIVIDVH